MRASLYRGFALRNAGESASASVRSTFLSAPPRGRHLQIGLLLLTIASTAFGQATTTASDPASEPAVLAVAKVLPTVVNINTERVVRRQVRDPFDDFAAQFFGVYRNRPRE